MSLSLRILVIEDDPRMLNLLRKGLWEHGHLVVTSPSGSEGLQLGIQHDFDVILLDIGLPELDGYQVASGLRANRRRAAMLMLTALDMEDDIVRGLELGADGYMTKPFSFHELLARINSLARRSMTSPASELRFAGWMIDTVQRKVFHEGKSLSVTRSEFLLLEQLVQHAGSPLTRETLTVNIWGGDAPVTRGVLDNLINTVRGKLGATLHGSHIKTIRGLGYSLQAGSDRPPENTVQ